MKDSRRPHETSKVRPDGRFAWPAVAIFSIAFVVRAIHVWQIRTAPFFTVLMGDSRAYDEWAKRIARGDWLGQDVFYQAPLYPYFLGTIYTLIGRDLLVVRLIQAIIGSAACVLLALAGWRLFSKAVGITAGLVLALYAPAIFAGALIQKSVLDIFFICLTLWLVSRIVADRSPELARSFDGAQRRAKPVAGRDASQHLILGPARNAEVRRTRERSGPESFEESVADRGTRPRVLWLELGLALGCLSLTRENSLALIGAIGLWLLAQRRRLGSERFMLGGVFIAGLAVVLLPVAVRNTVVGGEFAVTTAQFGPNFYIGNNDRSDGTYGSLRFGRGAPEYERQDATELAERALGRPLTPGEVSRYWTGRALAYVRSQPGRWVRLLARKFALLWNASEMLDTESQQTHAERSLVLRLAGSVTHFGVLVPLAFVGVWITWPDRRRLLLLYLMMGAYAISVVTFYIFARYRYPMVPFLGLFASAGLVGARRLVREFRARGIVVCGAATAAVAVFCNWPLLSPDLMRAITENNLGAALQEQSRHDEAIVHHRRALALRPDYAPAHNNLGAALRAQGKWGEAVEHYEQALRLEPDHPDAHYNLANAFLAQGKPDVAIRHFRRALELNPNWIEARNNLGIAYDALGRHEEAMRTFRQAIELDRNSAEAHYNLGNVLSTQGALDEAIDQFRRALELRPEYSSAHYELGNALLAQGKLAEAIDQFEWTLRIAPDSAEAHNNLGIALSSQGKLDAAIEHFEAALRINATFEDAKQNLTTALAARKEMRR